MNRIYDSFQELAGPLTLGASLRDAAVAISRPLGGEPCRAVEGMRMAPYFEADTSGSFDPTKIVTACIESGAQSLLLDEASLTPHFFDLSTGLAGELLHRLSIYRMRLAAVVPDPSRHSPHFQALAREANRGQEFRFFSTREEAVRWLETE